MLIFQNTTKITIVLFLVFSVLIFQGFVNIWWLLVLGLIYLTVIAIGSFHIRWNFFLKAEHYNYKITKNEIALTFDDGPHPEFTPKVLDLLKKHNLKATFFCIGKNIKKYPEIAKRIVFEGHLIANHSYSHTNDYGFLSTKKILEDIEKTQALLKEITTKENIFFRPPFGVTNPNIARAVKILHLHTFGWSIRSLDTKATKPSKVYRKITKRLCKGDVILLHDTSNLTCVVLERLLCFLDDKNIKSVRLNELFNYK